MGPVFQIPLEQFRRFRYKDMRLPAAFSRSRCNAPDRRMSSELLSLIEPFQLDRPCGPLHVHQALAVGSHKQCALLLKV